MHTGRLTEQVGGVPDTAAALTGLDRHVKVHAVDDVGV